MLGSGSPPPAFAPNEDEAESGPRSPASLRSQPNEKIALDGSSLPDDDGPFSHDCTDNAPIWKLYMDQARISDDNLANIFNSDLDPLLIFAGLFSAILSAFLIEIRKGLQEDLQNITNALLIVLIENQRNMTGPQIPALSRFEPTSSSRWVNGLWFSSLMFSLMSALGASLAKGWVTQFSSAASGSNWGDAALHCRRFRGVKRWRLKLIIQSLPILIHIAFILFSIGLVILVFQDDTAIGVVILGLTAMIAVLYVASSIHPSYSLDSPFRTPVSGMIRRMLNGSRPLDKRASFASHKAAQKAQALAWLLAESPNVDTINATIRAIAGLPASPAVQDQLLLNSATVGLLSRTLTSEFAKASPERESLRSCLYAVFHLVQTAPVNAQDTTSAQVFKAWLDQGALALTDSMPPGIREIAVCVKGRIILLLGGDLCEPALFETDIPVLIKSCGDTHLRRLLFQTSLLARRPVMASNPSSTQRWPCDFRVILSDPNASNRTEIHAELVRAAASGTELADSIAKFSARTLLDGLKTESSDLQRRYSELVSELASNTAFRKEMRTKGAELEICSLLRADDDDVRKHAAAALRLFAADDAGRVGLTTGLQGVIVNLPAQNPPIFWAIAEFLADVAHHDYIRRMMVDSETVRLIISRTDPGDEGTLKIALPIVAELTGYDDVREATTGATVVDFWLNIRISGAMQFLVIQAGHADVLDVISTAQNIDRIISILGDAQWHVRRMALEMIVALLPHDDIRRGISTPKYLERIIALLDDVDPDVREVAVDTVGALAQHDDLRAVISRAGIIAQVVNMLREMGWGARRSALRTIEALVQHDDVREVISRPQTIHTVITMLRDPVEEVQQSAVHAVVALAQYDDLQVVISTAENIETMIRILGNADWLMRKFSLRNLEALVRHDNIDAAMTAEALKNILAMLGHPDADVQLAAVDAVISLVHQDRPRSVISTAEHIEKIFRMLGNANWRTRRSGLRIIEALVRNGDFIPIISTTETFSKIIAMLGDSDSDVQCSAVDTVIALAQHDPARVVISKAEYIGKIMNMLSNEIWHTRRSALRTIGGLIPYDSVYAVISPARSVEKIIVMLEDPDSDVKCAVVDMIPALAQHDNVCTILLTSETIQKIISMVGEPDKHVQLSALNALLTLAPHASFRPLILAPETLVYTLQVLTGEDQDTHITSFMEKIIVLNHDIPVITLALAGATLAKIVQATPGVRKSYCKVISLLPVSVVAIPLEYTQQILPMLKNPDADIANSAIEMISYFATNAQFRQHMLSCNLCTVTGKLLQNPSTVQIALKMITYLAQYDSTREEITQSAEVIHRLLNMLKTGTADIDRWEVGMKGLLALGLL